MLSLFFKGNEKEKVNKDENDMDEYSGMIHYDLNGLTKNYNQLKVLDEKNKNEEDLIF